MARISRVLVPGSAKSASRKYVLRPLNWLSDEKYSKIAVEFPGSRRDILTRMGTYTEQATHS